MVLTQEDYEKFMAAKRARAQGEPPPKLPLNLLVKALIAGAFYEYLTYSDEYIGASVFYLVWNVLRLFIYGAFTKAIKKIVHRDKENATQAANVQDTIVLPYLIFIYEMYSADVMFHLLFLSKSKTLYSVGLVGIHGFDLLQILYTYRTRFRSGRKGSKVGASPDVMDIDFQSQSAINMSKATCQTKQSERFAAATGSASADDMSDVNEEIAGEAFQSNKAELPTAIMSASISRSQTVRDSHLSNTFETRELGTQIVIVESESKLTSAPLVNQSRQNQNGKSYESAFYTKGGTLSREAAKALKERAAAAVNSLSKAHAQLSPFMWLGRFTALHCASFVFCE
ncbi:hypothetical protein HDV05_000702, partial [Chytridiales sp. JEL 0842]